MAISLPSLSINGSHVAATSPLRAQPHQIASPVRRAGDARRLRLCSARWHGVDVRIDPGAPSGILRATFSAQGPEHMVDIVNGLLLRDGQVLMAKRAASRRIYPATWSFPGGHVEPGETFIQALTRELGEEIGVVPETVSALTVIHDATGPQRVSFHLFAVHSWQGEPRNLGDEHSELRWISPDAAAALPDLTLAAYAKVFTRLAAGPVPNEK